MFSPGKLAPALLGAFLSAALVVAPYRITFVGSSEVLLPQMAEAQDSEGSDSGEEGSSGNSGNTDADTEKQQPQTDEEQEEETKEKEEEEQELDPGGEEPADPATNDDVAIGDADLEVVYANGMREEIRNGRYEMIDAQGRTIINRPATEADLARLLAMAD